MTNAEKYLKDETYIFDIANGITDEICAEDLNNFNGLIYKKIIFWFTNAFKSKKPTLTEDERVILRNLAEDFKWIRKDEMGCLFVVQEINNFTTEKWDFGCFHCHLFQFIKERRRI